MGRNSVCAFASILFLSLVSLVSESPEARPKAEAAHIALDNFRQTSGLWERERFPEAWLEIGFPNAVL